MRLNSDQLPAALNRGLAPIYLVSGDEPLLVGEAADAVRAAARAAGFRDRTVFFVDRSFDWDELRHATQALSLFAERRLFELRMPSGKPDKGAAQLADIATHPPPDVVCLIITDKLDRKASEAPWVRAIESHGVWVPIWPVDAAALPALAARPRPIARTCELQPEAAQLIVDRVEGNLLAAKQELEKLALLANGEPIGEELVMRSVGDSARYDVFQLAEAAAAGDAQRALRVLMGLKSEGVEPTLILWALVRELRGLWQARERARAALAFCRGGLESGGQALGSARMSRIGTMPLARLLRQAGQTDRIIKGLARGDAWTAIIGLDRLNGRRFASDPGFRQGSLMNPMGIFGGTFDPIHYAHLRTAFELQQALRLKEITVPARRQSAAPRSADRRCAVAPENGELATAEQPGFVVDDREVRKAGPSYSVETLGELRHEYPDRSLCLIVGMDAFLSLPKWHQWRELLQLAHLVVAHRPGWRAPGMGPLGELLVDRGTGRIGDLHEQRAGCIYHPCCDAARDLLHGGPAADCDGPGSALPHAGFSA